MHLNLITNKHDVMAHDNSPFPSSGFPLSQNKFLCKTFPMKLRMICIKMDMQMKHIFISQNSFARRLVLIQRQTRTWKLAIYCSNSPDVELIILFYNDDYYCHDHLLTNYPSWLVMKFKIYSWFSLTRKARGDKSRSCYWSSSNINLKNVPIITCEDSNSVQSMEPLKVCQALSHPIWQPVNVN